MNLPVDEINLRELLSAAGSFSELPQRSLSNKELAAAKERLESCQRLVAYASLEAQRREIAHSESLIMLQRATLEVKEEQARALSLRHERDRVRQIFYLACYRGEVKALQVAAKALATATAKQRAQHTLLTEAYELKDSLKAIVSKHARRAGYARSSLKRVSAKKDEALRAYNKLYRSLQADTDELANRRQRLTEAALKFGGAA
jgi:hypothetical protein